MLNVNTKVKLVRPDGDPNWPPDIDHLVGETCYVVRYMGDHHGEAIYHVRAESDAWDISEFGALERWLQPIPMRGQVKCPLCGWPGEMGFNLVYCSNSHCQNGKGYGLEGKNNDEPGSMFEEVPF